MKTIFRENQHCKNWNWNRKSTKTKPFLILQIEYGPNVSNNICFDCQSRVKLAYKIRGELIRALEVKKKKKTIQVYQLITKSDSTEEKNNDDGSGVHEELVEIATIEEEEDYNDAEGTEEIYVETTKHEDDKEYVDEEEYFNENQQELIADDSIADEEPLDAVSFLLEKKELFKSDPNAGKKNRRSHKCEVCEKTFMRKSNLVDHLRLHANVRYVNKNCVLLFSSKAETKLT